MEITGLTLAAGMTWLFHPVGELSFLAQPASHDVTLDATKQWCITHAPASPCTCGQYTLEWQ